MWLVRKKMFDLTWLERILRDKNEHRRQAVHFGLWRPRCIGKQTHRNLTLFSLLARINSLDLARAQVDTSGKSQMSCSDEENRIGLDEIPTFYRGGFFDISVFSILSSLFSISSNRFSICVRTLPTSSDGISGSGVGDGHLLCLGLSGLLNGNGDG
jgi:hypothetical protein